MDLFYYIISYISFISPIILIMGVVCCIFHRVKSIKLRTIGLFFLCSLLIDILSRFIAYKTGNNLFLINCYNMIELIFLYLIIKQNSPSLSSKINLIFLIILGYNFYEIYTSEYLDHTQYQNYSNTVNSLFLLILSLNQILQDLKSDKITFSNNIFVYISIYLTFRTFLNLPINFIINYSDYLILIIWLFNIINISFFYSYLLSHLWKNGKTPK